MCGNLLFLPALFSLRLWLWLVAGGVKLTYTAAPPDPDDPFWCPWNPATGAQVCACTQASLMHPHAHLCLTHAPRHAPMSHGSPTMYLLVTQPHPGLIHPTTAAARTQSYSQSHAHLSARSLDTLIKQQSALHAHTDCRLASRTPFAHGVLVSVCPPAACVSTPAQCP